MPTSRRSLARPGIVLLACVALLGCNAVSPGTGSATAPAASPKATPTIDTAAGIRYANAAVKALNKDPFVVHIEYVSTGTAEANGQKIQMLVTVSADFAGDDLGLDIQATAVGANLDVRLRVVGKYAYAYQSGVWIKTKRSAFKNEIGDMIDAFRVIKDPHDLRYLGEERVGKQDLEHFRANREMPYDSGAGFKGHYDTFEIWVTKDGTPVRVVATFTASSPTVGTVTGSSTMDFTKFGGKIKIKVPKNKS